ncbi:hypothetical protein, partial [uncultured Treponema sp.]|uniref:hypothetical protein n=1 Tax=uncultured Treponema sp. TaxID=162155 RepID=UPI002590474D
MPWQAHYKCIQHKTGFQARFPGSKSRNNAFALIEIPGQTHVKIFCFKSLNYYLKNAQNGK